MPGDLLPSWRPGAAKTAVVEFVRSVTEPGASFVPPPDRIATFDNDGTLWCEKPMYPQADFLLRRWTQMARADPSLARQQPWKAVIESDRTWLASMLDHVPELIKAVTEAYDGITAEAFAAEVREFFDTARHPALGVPYTKIAFRPMRELIDLLQASGFEVYICSAGGRDFVRVVSQEMYGIPRQNVIGSGTTLEYRHCEVYRTRGVEHPSTTAWASRSTSGPGPGASRCWRAGTPTGTPRCCARRGSGC
jgi:phosphoglycolate phosphatase-like HAD superfamily hydrolase